MESFPYLSVMTFLPMVGALVIFFIPHITQQAARSIALITALGSLLISIVVLAGFDPQAPFQAGAPVPFQERIEWGREVGASYFLGIDGVAVLLLVLTTLISVVSIIWSWDTVNTRVREYYIAILLLETGMLGVFVALEHLTRPLGKDDRREWPERLAMFDPRIQQILHLGLARVGQDAAIAERARPELRTALKPADHFLLGQHLGRLGADILLG